MRGECSNGWKGSFGFEFGEGFDYVYGLDAEVDDGWEVWVGVEVTVPGDG